MEDDVFEAGNMLIEIIGSTIGITVLIALCIGHSSQLSQLTARFLTGLM